MKIRQFLTPLALLAAVVLTAGADDGHKHAKVGPTGGKLLHAVEPHAEFLVNAERKIEIRFIDDENKVIAPQEQEVRVTLGERSAPTQLTFVRDGDKLVSSQPIPAGELLPTVVRIKPSGEAKAISEKFNLNLAQCPTCTHPEYACICEHSGEEKEGHTH